MDRLFLDANVPFSAAYSPTSQLLALWSLDDIQLVTSVWAVEEARRNLVIQRRERLAVLEELLSRVTLITTSTTGSTEPCVKLADKDVPILQAAIESGCNVLLTGDKQHFGALYGQEIEGVLVQMPGQYLRSRNSS